jgi:hypothetical protein
MPTTPMTTLRLLALWLTAMPVHGYAPGCAPRAVRTTAMAAVAKPLFGRRQLLGSAAAFGSVLLSARPAAAVDEASALAIKVLDGAAKKLDGADALIQSGQWSELRNTVTLSLNAVVKGGVKARAAAIGGESETALLDARATLLSSLQAADKVAYDEQKKSFKNSKALFDPEGAAAGVKVPPWQRPSSAPVPPQGAPGGSGQLSSARPVRGWPTGRPASASCARASRLQAAHFTALDHPGAGDEVSRAASTDIAAAKTALAAITRELSKANVPPPTSEPKEVPTGITFLTKPSS